MRIIGSGLIADSVKTSLKLPINIYAKGISNSRVYSDADYVRDERELVNFLGQNSESLTCYISSSDLSIYEPFGKYLEHKKKLESIVLAFPNTMIIRMPQIVTIPIVEKSLLGWIIGCIERDEKIKCWSDVKRYPLHKDLIPIIYSKCDYLSAGVILDIRPKEGLTTQEIVNILNPNYINYEIEKIDIKKCKNDDRIIYSHMYDKTLSDSLYCQNLIRLMK